MSKRFSAWAASVLSAVVFIGLLALYGAPSWAAVGLGYLAFLIWRLGDKLHVDR